MKCKKLFKLIIHKSISSPEFLVVMSNDYQVELTAVVILSTGESNKPIISKSIS